MTSVLQVLTLLSVSVAMAQALAHALEFPGKLRLSRRDYETVQEIYYPGFTYGGGSEVIGLFLLLILLLFTSGGGTKFWLILAAFLALIIMHAVYWLFHPSDQQFLAQGLRAQWLCGALFRRRRRAGPTPLARLDGAARPVGICPYCAGRPKSTCPCVSRCRPHHLDDTVMLHLWCRPSCLDATRICSRFERRFFMRSGPLGPEAAMNEGSHGDQT